MEKNDELIYLFKCKVDSLQTLYDELQTCDQTVALDNLRDLLKTCEGDPTKIKQENDVPMDISLGKTTEGQVRSPGKNLAKIAEDVATSDMVVKLEAQLEELREENRKLRSELEKISKKFGLAEPETPEEIVASILNDILFKVVPPVLRRGGRTRKGEPKPTPTKPSTPPESGLKRKRGRPRKNPNPQFNPAAAVQNDDQPKPVKRKRSYIERYDADDSNEKMPPLDEIKKENLDTSVENEENDEETEETEGLRLRSRRTRSTVSTSAVDSDEDDHHGVSFEVDSESDDEVMPRLRNPPMRPRKRIRGMPGSRPRGRPRKHPIRDPNTIRRHKRVIRHECQLCSAQFLHGRPFHRHLSMRHDPGGACCKHCKKEFENFAHYLHHKCESKRVRKDRVCKRCNGVFKSFRKLQEHVQKEHGMKNIDPIYFCKFCEKGFIRKPSLINHLKHHAEGQYVCEKCGEFSPSQEEADKHLATHVRPTTGSLKCDRCGAIFDRRQQFEQHIAAHEKYDCSICNTVFSRKKMLLKHVRDVHGIKVAVEEKKHVCEQCGRAFHRPGQLDIHMRVHTGERPIECTTCKMFFKSNKALWKHRQTHTHQIREGSIPLEKNHLCAICGKAYFRKQALQRHMRYHDNSKPFKCQHCAYRCRDHNNLKRHISLHFSSRNFVCELCGAAFHAKKTLETHGLYKHSNNRVHKCPDCPMTFKTPNSLRRHRVIHATVRPYKCPSCSMGFNRLYNLRRHMKGVHGNDDVLPPVNRVKLLDMPEGQEYLKGAAAFNQHSKTVMTQAEFFGKSGEGKKGHNEEGGAPAAASTSAGPTPPPQPHPGHSESPDLLSRGGAIPLTVPHLAPQPSHHPAHMYLPPQVAAAAANYATTTLEVAQQQQQQSNQPLSLTTSTNPLHIPAPYMTQAGRVYLPTAPPPHSSPSPSPHLQPTDLTPAHLPAHHHHHHHHHNQQSQAQQQQLQQQQPVVSQADTDGQARIIYPDMYSSVGSILHLMNNSVNTQ